MRFTYSFSNSTLSLLTYQFPFGNPSAPEISCCHMRSRYGAGYQENLYVGSLNETNLLSKMCVLVLPGMVGVNVERVTGNIRLALQQVLTKAILFYVFDKTFYMMLVQREIS